MPDQLTTGPQPHHRSSSRHAWLLMEAVRAMHALGEEAEERGEQTVALMAHDDRQSVAAAEAQLQEAADDPMLRWSINRIVGQIHTESAVALLRDQGTRTLASHDPAGGCEQRADIEVLVSVMAVEGLAAQAAAGLDSAVDALLDVLGQAPSLEVSRVAGTLLARLRPDLEQQVRDLLGTDQRLLDLRPAEESDLRPDGDVPGEPPDADGPHGQKPPYVGRSQGDPSTPRAGALR